MIAKLKTLYWFVSRPAFYWHGLELFLRKFRLNYDSPDYVFRATKWAKQNVVSVEKALHTIGLIEEGIPIPTLDKQLISEANSLAQKSKVQMGGAGDIELIYAATHLSKANFVIETGVAYGWSSLSILAAFNNSCSPLLVSIDMPYPKMDNEDYVGIVIPSFLKEYWHLIRKPDRKGIISGLKMFDQPIDLCHYDSDKSYYGRSYAYPLLWNSLKEGGIFISDDIQDNFAFKDFVESMDLVYAVTEYKGKYIGITRK